MGGTQNRPGVPRTWWGSGLARHLSHWVNTTHHKTLLGPGVLIPKTGEGRKARGSSGPPPRGLSLISIFNSIWVRNESSKLHSPRALSETQALDNRGWTPARSSGPWALYKNAEASEGCTESPPLPPASPSSAQLGQAPASACPRSSLTTFPSGLLAPGGETARWGGDPSPLPKPDPPLPLAEGTVTTEDLLGTLLTPVMCKLPETRPHLKKLSHHCPGPPTQKDRTPAVQGTSWKWSVASGARLPQPVMEGAASLVWAPILAVPTGHPMSPCSVPPPYQEFPVWVARPDGP